LVALHVWVPDAAAAFATVQLTLRVELYVQSLVQQTGAAVPPAHVQPAGHAAQVLPAPVPFR